MPLGNEPVYLEDRLAGKTTSAAFGYRVGRPLAIADLALAEARAEGAPVSVDIAGERFAAGVTLQPAFDPQGLRMRGLRPVASAQAGGRRNWAARRRHWSIGRPWIGRE